MANNISLNAVKKFCTECMKSASEIKNSSELKDTRIFTEGRESAFAAVLRLVEGLEKIEEKIEEKM